jgi:hypothetical protein
MAEQLRGRGRDNLFFHINMAGVELLQLSGCGAELMLLVGAQGMKDEPCGKETVDLCVQGVGTLVFVV